MEHLAERGWVCVAPNYRLSPQRDVARPDRRREAGHRVGQGQHRRARRRPRLRRHHRRVGRRAPGVARGAHPGVTGFQPGFEDADTALAAAVPLYGVYDFTNRHGDGRSDLSAS